MKANEAPEKIYIEDSMSTDTIGELWPEWFDDKVSDNSIEYIRTDVFIEKACEFIAGNMRCDGYTLQTKAKFIEEFRNHMKGE